MVVGFENGTVEVYKHRSGELLHSLKVGTKAIQKLFYYDYRQAGSKQIISVDAEGNIKGF